MALFSRRSLILIDHRLNRVMRVQREFSIDSEVLGILKSCGPKAEQFKLPEVCIG